MTDRSKRLPAVHDDLWLDSEGTMWRIRFHWGWVGDHVECTGMEISSLPTRADHNESIRSRWERPTPAPLTTAVLRELNFSSMVGRVKSGLADFHGWWAGTDPDRREELEAVADRLRSGSGKKAGRPPKYGPDHWKQVAETVIARPPFEKPSGAIRRHYRISASNADKWLRKLKELGFPTELEEG